jgi:hypothetical protein
MITIEALSQRDAKTLKDIRLRALQDTPIWFRCGWHRRIAEPGSAQRWYITYSNGRALKMSA